MTRFYDEYIPSFQDRSDWNSPTVLRHHAEERPNSVYLNVPWANESYSYAETLDLSERVASGMLSTGASSGDRVLIMIQIALLIFLRGWGVS